MFKKVSAIIVLVNTYKTIKYLVNYKELNILKKKIKYKIAIPTIIVLGLLSYIFLTPIGALRFAVFRMGVAAKEGNLILLSTTLKVDYESCRRPPEGVIEGDQTVYDLIDYPVAPLTQAPLDSWVITKHGIFYWGEYYFV